MAADKVLPGGEINGTGPWKVAPLIKKGKCFVDHAGCARQRHHRENGDTTSDGRNGLHLVAIVALQLEEQ